MSPGRQLPLDLPHRPALGMEDFLVTPCNVVAVRWIDRWPDWPGPVLAITGPSACGKTHLAHVWQSRSGAAMLSARALAPATVRAGLGEASCAVAEDADPPLSGEAEQGLFHLCNLVAERGGHLLVTAARPLAQAAFALPDLASRLRAAAAAEIGAPDDDLLAAVLIKHFADRQLAVPAEVVDYLVRRIERSFSGARRAAEEIDRAALAQRRKVTLALAREVLGGGEG